ncbi:MAG: ester cyclase [Bacteroidota bacterium]
MRKILIAAFAGLFCICTSCNNAPVTANAMSDEEQKNLAASQTITKAFQTGDVAGIDSVVADNFLDHTDRGDFTGRDSLKSMVKWVHANFKDAKTETIQEVAKGEYVWSWMRYTGTSNGVPGMPNGPYDMQAVELAKFKDGKAVEHWNFMETQDMMAMMAQAPPMSNMNKPDSTKK